MRNTPDFLHYIGCRCKECNQNKRTCKDIKKLILKKLDMKIVDTITKVPETPAVVNLCEEVSIGEDLMINYMYKDVGRQMMILDIRAPVSITGVPWMEQYLEEFGLRINNMKSVECH